MSNSKTKPDSECRDQTLRWPNSPTLMHYSENANRTEVTDQLPIK